MCLVGRVLEAADNLSLSVAETEMRMMVNSSTIDREYALTYVSQKRVLS